MPGAPAFPPFDYTRFQWCRAPDDPHLLRREAFGGEAIEDFFHRFNHGEQTLFLGLRLTLHAPVTPSDLVARAREAWTRLRHEVPLVATKLTYNAAGNTLITYREAAAALDVTDWACRTVRLSQVADLDELRFALSTVTIPDEDGNLTLLYVLPGGSETSCSLLIQTSHVPFDGGGIKVLGNKLLALLAAGLADGAGAPPPLQWGDEGKNLLPCVTEILAPDEEREGERYTHTLMEVLGDIGAALPRLHGFKPRGAAGPGPTRRLGHTFSAADSKTILEHARALGFTLNHIAHAALTLVAAFDNPAQAGTPADAAFVYYGLVDARARLAAPYNARDAYPGYCLGMSVIQVPLSLCPTAAAPDTRDALIKVAHIVKEQYLRQKAYPSLLAVDGQQVELMLAGIRAAASPPPPWMGPWYGGDGRGETYLDPVHTDGVGAPVLDLDDFFVALNKTDPGPFFRATSWKGRLMLSVDTNVAAMPADVTRGFMDMWAAILLTLAACT